MGEVLGQAAGIRVELDVERLGGLISQQVAEQLAGLFPAEAGEFWAALCDQAYRERKRVAAMLDLVCPHQDQCPHRSDVLSGLRFAGEPGGRDEKSAAPAVERPENQPKVSRTRRSQAAGSPAGRAGVGGEDLPLAMACGDAAGDGQRPVAEPA